MSSPDYRLTSYPNLATGESGHVEALPDGRYRVRRLDTRTRQAIGLAFTYTDRAAAHEHARRIARVESVRAAPTIDAEVTHAEPGYAHTRLSGICGPTVTVEDIQRRFYHPVFGGRGAHVANGQWECIRHDD